LYRFWLEIRRHDDLEEDLGHSRRGLSVHRAVQRYDSAEGGDGIAEQCEGKGVGDGVAHGGPARNRVLHDRHCRFVESAKRTPGRVGIEQVIERELLTLKLSAVDDARSGAACIESLVGRGALSGILSVPQILQLAAGKRDF